jgi:putative hydrolase of the HAD superfamily
LASPANGDRNVRNGWKADFQWRNSKAVQPTAILFDLDDTLVNRAAGLAKYAQHLHAEFRADLNPCSWGELHKAVLAADDFGSMDQAEALAASRLWRTAPRARVLYEHWDANFGSMATPFPGCLELLTDLHRASVRLGLITNGESAMQRSKIAAIEVETLMEAIVISAEVGFRKPDPRIFALAVSWLGCTPSDVWFVGDRLDQDIRGAAAAGLTPVWVNNGAFNSADVRCIHIESVASLRSYVAGRI